MKKFLTILSLLFVAFNANAQVTRFNPVKPINIDTIAVTDSTTLMGKTDILGEFNLRATTTTVGKDSTTANITSGALDGVTIGASSAGAGTFTTLAGTTSIVAGSDITITSGSILSASGAITFGNENLSTTGNVGIGGTPSYLVHALSSSTDGTWMGFTNSDTGGKVWRIGSSGSGAAMGAGAFAFYNVTDDAYPFYISTANVVRVQNANSQMFQVVHNGSQNESGLFVDASASSGAGIAVLSLNQKAGGASRISFKDTGTEKYLLGLGAASQNEDWELYDSVAGVFPIKYDRSSSTWLVNSTTNTTIAEFNGGATSAGEYNYITIGDANSADQSVAIGFTDAVSASDRYGWVVLNGEHPSVGLRVADGGVVGFGSGADLITTGNRIDLDTDNDTSIRATADDVITFETGGYDVMQINYTGDWTKTFGSASTTAGVHVVSYMQIANGTTNTSGDISLVWKQGDGTGTANNMSYNWTYDTGDGFFALVSGDGDGAGNGKRVISVDDGTASILIGDPTAITNSSYIEDGLLIYDSTSNASNVNLRVWRGAASGTDNNAVAIFENSYASATGYVVGISNSGTGDLLNLSARGSTNQNTGLVRFTDYGGSTAAAFIRGQTSSTVTSTPSEIAQANGRGGLFWIVGDDGSNFFLDLVFHAYNGTPTVLASLTQAGAPASRTYSNASGHLGLAMGSGTYTTNCLYIGVEEY